MMRGNDKAESETTVRARWFILALACGLGFACGSVDNPTQGPYIKVTPIPSPRPTETAAPEPPPAVPTATSEAELPPPGPETFRDNFDSPNGWAEEQTERYAMGRGEGGVYRMEFLLAGDHEVLFSIQPHAFSLPPADMELRAEGTGMSGEGAYGLVCRHTDAFNYYTFHISTDGRYWLYRQVDGEWTNLGSGSHEAVREENAIGLRCVGTAISATVNGVMVAEAVDSGLAAGNAGLFAQPLGEEIVGAWTYYAVFTSFEMTVYP
jgi:hypothetical protein